MQSCYVDRDSRSIADLIKPGELHAGYTISRINVPRESRGKGIGSMLLDQICRDADEGNHILYLEISPSDGLDFDQLRTWYMSRGFRPLQSGYYRRRPNAQ